MDRKKSGARFEEIGSVRFTRLAFFLLRALFNEAYKACKSGKRLVNSLRLLALWCFLFEIFFIRSTLEYINAQFELNYKSVDQFTSKFVFIERVPKFAIGIFDHFVGLGWSELGATIDRFRLNYRGVNFMP